MTATTHTAGGFLRTAGSEFVGPDGAPILLRGVCLGGWLNMENFITGYPATESQHRKALARALGEEGYRRFFDRFLSAFFDEDDAAFGHGGDLARVGCGGEQAENALSHRAAIAAVPSRPCRGRGRSGGSDNRR